MMERQGLFGGIAHERWCALLSRFSLLFWDRIMFVDVCGILAYTTQTHNVGAT